MSEICEKQNGPIVGIADSRSILKRLIGEEATYRDGLLGNRMAVTDLPRAVRQNLWADISYIFHRFPLVYPPKVGH